MSAFPHQAFAFPPCVHTVSEHLSAVFMLQEPLMDVKVIKRQSQGCKHHAREKQLLPFVHEQGIAQSDAKCYAALPSQNIRALRRATLTMSAQLDKKEEEARTDNPD